MLDSHSTWKVLPLTNGRNCINPCENGWVLDPAWRSQSANGSRGESFVLSKPSVPSALLKPPWQWSQGEIHPLPGQPQGCDSHRATDTSPQNLCQALEPSLSPILCCQHWDRVIRHPGNETAVVCGMFFPFGWTFPISHPWFPCTDVLPSLLPGALAWHLEADPAGLSLFHQSCNKSTFNCSCLSSLTPEEPSPSSHS